MFGHGIVLQAGKGSANRTIAAARMGMFDLPPRHSPCSPLGVFVNAKMFHAYKKRHQYNIYLHFRCVRPYSYP